MCPRLSKLKALDEKKKKKTWGTIKNKMLSNTSF